MFKGGDKTNVRNYRSIPILWNFAKVFESILYSLIFTDFNITVFHLNNMVLLIKDLYGYESG